MRVSECFDQIWKKYREDLKVCEAFKRIGPAFPLPGPHYDYLDLIEHIRYTLFKLCTCSPLGMFVGQSLLKKKKKQMRNLKKNWKGLRAISVRQTLLSRKINQKYGRKVQNKRGVFRVS
jgi:hypothetical protein